MSRIGKNIKKARSEKGYTQEQLAQKLSVTRNTISNYETGLPDLDKPEEKNSSKMPEAVVDFIRRRFMTRQ